MKMDEFKCWSYDYDETEEDAPVRKAYTVQEAMEMYCEDMYYSG